MTLIDRLWHVGLWIAFRAMRVYWFVFRPRVSSVHVAVWCRGRVLVIRNSYKRHSSIPAGGVHRGEELAEAAARELREEVGIEVPADQLRLAQTICSRCESKHDTGHFFEIEFSTPPPVRVDGREVIQADFETPRQALARELSGPVRIYLEKRLKPEEPSEGE